MRGSILILATVLGNAQVQPVPQVPTGKGSIEGRVVNQVTGEPVRRARVSLSGVSYLNAVTDATGHFAFKQLPAGTFGVQAEASDYPVAPLRIGKSSAQVTLAADEHKSDLALALVPGASISGHVADEEGSPLANCQVAAMQFDYSQGAKTLTGRGYSKTNQKGEYRITNVAVGRYYVQARCFEGVPLPHGLMRRGADVEPPMQTYRPIFYPGAELAGATRVAAAAGADAGGIDFRMSPSGGVTVRGHVTVSAPEGQELNIQVMLAPQDGLSAEWRRMFAMLSRRTGNFSVQHVPPGLYQIVVGTVGPGDVYHARTTVTVGAVAPEPVQIMAVRASPLSGSISYDGDSKASFENVRVTLAPLENGLPGRQADAEVRKDGSFTLSVPPGRWRLQVGNLVGYVKSVALGDKESSSLILDVGSGSAGSLKIVAAIKGTDVDGSVVGVLPGGGEISGLIWPADEEMHMAGLDRTFTADAQGHFSLPGVPPGNYYGCALAITQPWNLMGNVGLLNAIKGRCAKLELVEGVRTSVQIPFVSAGDLDRLAEEAENEGALH